MSKNYHKLEKNHFEDGIGSIKFNINDELKPPKEPTEPLSENKMNVAPTPPKEEEKSTIAPPINNNPAAPITRYDKARDNNSKTKGLREGIRNTFIISDSIDEKINALILYTRKTKREIIELLLNNSLNQVNQDTITQALKEYRAYNNKPKENITIFKEMK